MPQAGHEAECQSVSKVTSGCFLPGWGWLLPPLSRLTPTLAGPHSCLLAEPWLT